MGERGPYPREPCYCLASPGELSEAEGQGTMSRSGLEGTKVQDEAEIDDR